MAGQFSGCPLNSATGRGQGNIEKCLDRPSTVFIFKTGQIVGAFDVRLEQTYRVQMRHVAGLIFPDDTEAKVGGHGFLDRLAAAEAQHDIGVDAQLAQPLVDTALRVGTARNELQASLVHPYSKALSAAAPVPDRRADAVRSLPEPAIKGEVPSPINLPSGCRFHPRCPLRQSICQTSVPKIEIVNSLDIRCHFAVDLAA